MKKRKGSFCLLRRLPIFLCLMVVSLGTLSAQVKKISINEANKPLKFIIEKIEKSSGYNFLYNNQLVDVERICSIHCDNEAVTTVLDKLFEGTDIVYKIVDKQVIISHKEVAQKVTTTTASPQKDQKVKVTGRVVDKNGEPMYGAHVLLEGTTIGAFVDETGRYTLEFDRKGGECLLFMLIGMKEVKVQCNNEGVINVTLLEDNVMLDDVVVIGYGSKTRKSLTSSVSSVKKETMESLSPTALSVDYMLGGTMKGVSSVQGTGELGKGANINIRGITSPLPNMFSTRPNNAPLYVIDGVPIFVENNTINPLINLSPNDIESIDVLKDASATAIYGSRGANGIIIIQTKNGKRGEKISIEAGCSYSFANPIKVCEALNAKDYKIMQDELIRESVKEFNAGNTDTWDDTVLAHFANIVSEYDSWGFVTKMEYHGLKESSFGNADTNWEREILKKNAGTHRYFTTLRGGSETTNYSFSFNAQNQDGIYIKDRLNHYGSRISLDSDINKYIKMGGALNYSYSKRNSPSVDGTNMRFGGAAWQTRPDLPVYDENGEFSRINGIAQTGGGFDMFRPSPVAQREVKSLFENNQILGNAYLDINIVKGLKFHSDFNLASYFYSNDYFLPIVAQGIYSIMETKSELIKDHSKMTSLSANFRFDYNLMVDNHYFAAMVGYGGDRYVIRGFKNTYERFPNDHFLNNMGSALTETGRTESVSKSALNSLYARISYDYASRYLLEASLRGDASSKFGPKNRIGYFPALSLGWNIRNEEFMKEFTSMDLLKLRASAGSTGSTNVEDFSYLQFYERASNGVYNNKFAITLMDVLPNQSIKWEMTTEYNTGLDFGFFNGRLYGSIDAYYRYTAGALSPAPHVLESGLSIYWDNVIDMSNKGIEFEIGGDIIRNNKFLWRSYFNIATNKNKIEKINNAEITPYMQDSFIEGMPVGTQKGYLVSKILQDNSEIDALNAAAVAKGFPYYQRATTAGDYLMTDVNGDGRITDEDRVVIANPESKFFGGWSNTFTYERLSMTCLFQYAIGGQAIYYPLQIDAWGIVGDNMTAYMYGKTWSETNRNAPFAKRIYDTSNRYNATQNDKYVFDKSYLRLKNITVSYDLPISFTRSLKLQGISLYASGTNLLTFTKWPGADPELVGNTPYDMAVNEDIYPLSKAFTFGVNFKF